MGLKKGNLVKYQPKNHSYNENKHTKIVLLEQVQNLREY